MVNAGNGPNEFELPIDWWQGASFPRPQPSNYTFEPNNQLASLSRVTEHLQILSDLGEFKNEWCSSFLPNSENFIGTRAWRSSDVTTLIKAVYAVGPDNIGREHVANLWSLRDRDGESAFHFTVRTENFPEKALEIISLGASLSDISNVRPHEITTRRDISHVKLNSLEVALNSGKFPLAVKILDRMTSPGRLHAAEEKAVLTADIGDQLNGLISAHRWAELSMALETIERANQFIHESIVKGALNWTPVEQEIPLIILALTSSAPKELVNKMMEMGARYSFLNKSMSDQRNEIFNDLGATETVDEVGLLKSISEITSDFRIRKDFNKDIFKEAKSLFKQHFNLQHLYWYYDLYRDSCIEYPPGSCRSAAKLAGHLQLNYPPNQIEDLVNAVESYNDFWFGNDQTNRGSIRHPFFREMALLLYHPKAPDFRPDDVAHFTRAITSQDQWIRKRVNLNRDTVFNWVRLGKYTHDFRALKWDTVKPKEPRSNSEAILHPSLIEIFGAEAIRPRPTDTYISAEGVVTPRLGSGFLLKGKQFNHTAEIPDGFGGLKDVAIHPELEIEFRRSYIRVSLPSDGVLIITNSSPEFGRGCFEEPFYWLPPDEVGVWNSLAQMELTESLVNRKLYTVDDRQKNRLGSTTKYLDQLISQLAAVRDYYRLWKFNNHIEKAWDPTNPIDEYKLLGGHRSPGFKKVVEQLGKISKFSPEFQLYGAPVVDLGFFDTRMPPWSPLAFVELGEVRNRLSITPKVLQALERIVSADSPAQEYEDDFAFANIREFLSLGLDGGDQVELVILDSTNKKIGRDF